MDSISHTLMGAIIYGSINKTEMDTKHKRAFLFATMVGTQIPDIDVVSQLWDTEGMYQMWHRGITHSLSMVPVWALIIWGLCFLIWRTRSKSIFFVSALTVLVHISFDALNTWGTGLLEPFSMLRVSYGFIPIIDFMIWGIMLVGFIVTRIYKKIPSFKVYRWVWAVIAVHVLLQSVQGLYIHNQTEGMYETQVVSAQFVPGTFNVIGKKDNVIEILNGSVWTGMHLKEQLLTSEDETLLEKLFEGNKRARTLHRWSPFVVVFENENEIGIFDPRFYRNGSSFLTETINK